MLTIQVFKLGKITKIALEGLTDVSSKEVILTELSKYKVYGTHAKLKTKGDHQKDIDNFHPKIKISSLRIFLDDNKEIIGYQYDHK